MRLFLTVSVFVALGLVALVGCNETKVKAPHTGPSTGGLIPMDAPAAHGVVAAGGGGGHATGEEKGPPAGKAPALKGVVKLAGEVPERKKADVKPFHPPECHKDPILMDDLLVDKATKGIQNVIIRVKDVKGDPAPVPAEPPSINQAGCVFVPHILVIAPGTKVKVLNPEKIPHNFHTTPLDLENDPVNQMTGDVESIFAPKYFAKPEILKVTCDLHPWMVGYIAIHDPRYTAISGKDGSFSIPTLPPGKYKVAVFHETLGEKELDVEIKDGQTADMGEIKWEKK